MSVFELTLPNLVGYTIVGFLLVCALQDVFRFIDLRSILYLAHREVDDSIHAWFRWWEEDGGCLQDLTEIHCCGDNRYALAGRAVAARPVKNADRLHVCVLSVLTLVQLAKNRNADRLCMHGRIQFDRDHSGRRAAD